MTGPQPPAAADWEFRDMAFEDVGFGNNYFVDPQQLKVWGLHT